MDEQTSALLEGVDFPITKPELIRAAVDRGEEEALLSRLEALPDQRFDDADRLARELNRTRASSNPALVAITIEPCEHCGFPRKPGEPHSCVEEKARFADSANSVTDEFETLDDARS